ncbi:MAG: winged helix DNA-binding domain-containing protein, partial [Acidimicrobiia bacterium]
LATRARVEMITVEQTEHAFYEARSVIRLLGMRRTMFAAPIDLARLIQSGAASRLVAGERKRTTAMIAASGITSDPATWLEELEARTLEAVRSRGPSFTRDLTKVVPELAIRIVAGEGTRWAVPVGVSTRVLFLLALAGHIARDRPRGNWTNSEHRWAPIQQWAADGLGGADHDFSQREIVRRWLYAFGPGTIEDLRWWTGWTLAEVRKCLKALEVSEVDLEGQSGYLLTKDLGPLPKPRSWISFLPALDSSPMGWKERDWYLGAHRNQLFDRSGNIGPTIWHNGRIIGGWAQRPDRRIGYRLLESVSSRIAKEVESEARALQEWIGETKVTPRFRTPLEIELGQ